jgi:uncharacterized protein YcfJ
MFTRTAATLFWTATLTASGIAHADSRRHDDHGQHGHAYRGPVYDYARVVDVDPIVRRIRVDEPRQVCWTETRYIEPAPRARIDKTGAAIVGGVVGAAVGSQVAHGDNRVPATVAGAAIGSVVGYQIAANREDRYEYRPAVVRDVERCELRPGHAFVDRVDGYRVTYVYAGQRYTEVLPHDPGRRVRIAFSGRPRIVI